LITVSLLPLSTAALSQKTSTEVNALIEKGNALDDLGNYTGAIQYYDKWLKLRISIYMVAIIISFQHNSSVVILPQCF